MIYIRKTNDCTTWVFADTYQIAFTGIIGEQMYCIEKIHDDLSEILINPEFVKQEDIVFTSMYLSVCRCPNVWTEYSKWEIILKER